MNKKAKINITVAIAVFCIAVIAVVFTLFLNTQSSNIVYHGSSSNVLSQDKDRKNTLIIGVSSAITDNHPYFHNTDALFFFQKLVYEPLISINNDGSIEYLNAADITFENNGIEAKVILNKKQTFSDGTKITSDIVINSYNSFIEEGTSYNDLLDNVEYIQKVDDYTLVFRFKQVRIYNTNVFNIPIIYQSGDNDDAVCLGTGNYTVKSITPYGDSVLERNEYAKEKGKYKSVILRPMDYGQLDTLSEEQNFDIFIMNKETQADIIKSCNSYDIYELSLQTGWYLNYNNDNLSVRNAVSSLASGEEFFEETHDFGAYSKGITSAYMSKPNYHSLIKKGSLDEIESLTFLHNYQAEANGIYQALSAALAEKNIQCSDIVSDFSDYPSEINTDVLIYYGSLTDMINDADHERFFESNQNIAAEDFNKNIEKYFAEENKITPLSKDTVWYASLAGKNALDLFD